MSFFKLSMLAGVAAASIAAASPASALTTSTSAQFGPAPTDYNGAGAGASTLNYFNTALGNLTSVAFTVTYGFNSTITVTNSSQGASSGSVRTESASAFRSTASAVNQAFNTYVNQAGAATVGGVTINPAAFDVFGQNRSYSLTAGQSTQLSSNSATQTFGSGTVTDATTLAAFSNANGGTFLAQLITATGTLLGNTGGNTSASQNTTATGTINIVYNYDAAVVPPPTTVPEPASIALLGAGLLGLGMIRRKSV